MRLFWRGRRKSTEGYQNPNYKLFDDLLAASRKDADLMNLASDLDGVTSAVRGAVVLELAKGLSPEAQLELAVKLGIGSQAVREALQECWAAKELSECSLIVVREEANKGVFNPSRIQPDQQIKLGLMINYPERNSRAGSEMSFRCIEPGIFAIESTALLQKVRLGMAAPDYVQQGGLVRLGSVVKGDDGYVFRERCYFGGGLALAPAQSNDQERIDIAKIDSCIEEPDFKARSITLEALAVDGQTIRSMNQSSVASAQSLYAALTQSPTYHVV